MKLPGQLPRTGKIERLAHAGFEVGVAPDCGARIVYFRSGGRDILRPASADTIASADPYGFSAFPLLPYSGPIFGGGFDFGAARYTLARNVPAEPFATHGEGWIRGWTTASQAADRISLTLDYEPRPGLSPFRWRGEIEYRLDDDGFETTMALINTDTSEMPAGMGFHPYFPKVAGDVLRFGHGRVWPPDEPDAVRRTPVRTPDAIDFNAGLDVAPIVLDRCYEDWDGTARIDRRDGWVTTLKASQAFGKLQILLGWDLPYVCIEPVTNANDGFNRAALGVPDHGVVTLKPGDRMKGCVRISASATR